MGIPNEFTIFRGYGDVFFVDKRIFKLVKIYKNFALYECIKRIKENNKVKDQHLFYESFKFTYLYNEEYKTNKLRS